MDAATVGMLGDGEVRCRRCGEGRGGAATQGRGIRGGAGGQVGGDQGGR
jgi:hypothetical protein